MKSCEIRREKVVKREKKEDLGETGRKADSGGREGGREAG